MYRRLIVMRHAKSSWSDPTATDHERPLNLRGQREAPRVAARLVELQWHPDWVLSSDALRTRETMAGMQTVFRADLPVHYHRSLYHAGLDAVRQEVAEVPDEVQTLMLLGHNPGWEELVFVLCGEDVELKTASAALLDNQADTWSQALQGRDHWQLRHLLRSREL